ncbi:HNH endonuclease signature motif containing protein [Thermococcus sp. SY098]|uniref:HNH endonuclease n=1 Tax=Thermococcus sp. SY098 TaxID=3111325 RepID=UPI002D77C082|nr:HNH endonuclease signature motif containing protein [Thermococcus sp. SY098]WRS53422.1 HNH endonuclease signature motif containing protein [Thermococcus sp. SY098]
MDIFWFFERDEGERKKAARSLTDSQKRAIMEAVGFKCEVCGKKLPPSALHIHHITPVSEGGTNRVDNIIVVCANCHNLIHRANKYPREKLRKIARNRSKKVKEQIRQILSRNKSKKSTKSKSRSLFDAEISTFSISSLLGSSSSKRKGHRKKEKNPFDIEIPTWEFEDPFSPKSKKRKRKKR